MAEGVVVGGGAALPVSGDYAIGEDIVRRPLTEPAYLIATNAGHPGQEVVARVRSAGRSPDHGFDALEGRYGDVVEMGIGAAERASVAGLPLTTNSLIAEEQTPWGGSAALMTEFGELDEGIRPPRARGRPPGFAPVLRGYAGQKPPGGTT